MRPGALFGDKTSLESALYEWCADKTAAQATHGNIATWDVSAVTQMNALIHGTMSDVCRSTFDEDLNAWNVSQVTSMNVRHCLRQGLVGFG